MSAVLLDTHALIWLMNGQRIAPAAQVAIAEAQLAGRLFISAISAWEAGVALTKFGNTPDLGGRAADEWFRDALALPGTRIVGITRRIALEASKVPAAIGSGDPGDCFLVATARVRKIPIVTRDRPMIRLAQQRPEYLTVIRC